MAPKGRTPRAAAISDAKDLQSKHGTLLSQEPYSQCTSPYLLHKALHNRTDPIVVSMGIVKQWWTHHRESAGRPDVCTAHDLNEKHRDLVLSLVCTRFSGHSFWISDTDGTTPPAMFNVNGTSARRAGTYPNYFRHSNQGGQNRLSVGSPEPSTVDSGHHGAPRRKLYGLHMP